MSDNVYQIITSQIVDSLNKGVAPWRKPWSVNTTANGFVAMPRNLRSNNVYRGINVFLLLARGHQNPYFATKKQIRESGGNIKDGEWPNATKIIYWKPTEDPVEVDEKGKSKTSMIMRYYYVYNLDQTEGVKLPKTAEEMLSTKKKRMTKPQRLKKAEEVVKGFKDAPKVFEDLTGEAYYSILADEIHMPPAEDFPNAEQQYYTLFHELGHSTLHKDRLNRQQRNPDENVKHAYGREELVAEMTNSFLCAHADISPAVVENQAAYIASWLKTIQEDEHMVVACAAAAQKAADYILGNDFSYERKPEDAKTEG